MGSFIEELGLDRKMNALVVDDNKIQRLIHSKKLISLGINVMDAGNGKEAVDLCKSGKCFDLILMDMEMPIMDGIQATKLLRDMGVTSVIVGVSARSEEEEKQQFLDAGINDYVEKPLNHVKLVSILRAIGKKH